MSEKEEKIKSTLGIVKKSLDPQHLRSSGHDDLLNNFVEVVQTFQKRMWSCGEKMPRFVHLVNRLNGLAFFVDDSEALSHVVFPRHVEYHASIVIVDAEPHRFHILYAPEHGLK